MLELFESVLSWSCGLVVVIWISIGTLARSEKIERLSHNVMTILCFLTAIGLVVKEFNEHSEIFTTFALTVVEPI